MKNSPESVQTNIYILPSFFTAGNLFFGFLAIIRCIQAKYAIDGAALTNEYYTQAVWFILLAFVCDALDGRVARLKGEESLFGKEFDSIADVVSFGVAPALMMFFLILSPSEGYPIIRKIGWIIGFIYLTCAGVRLARFNVITHPLLPQSKRVDTSDDFIGLPVPAAAAFITSLVPIMMELEMSRIWLFMPGLMLLIAFLMVSTIRYPSFKKINGDTKIKFRAFLAIVSLVTLLILFKEYALALVFILYISYGLIRHLSQFFPLNILANILRKKC